jgi:hypothetical protein
LYGFPSGESSFEVDLEVPPDMYWINSDSRWRNPGVFLKDIDNDGRDEIHYFPGYKGNNPDRYFIYESDGTLRLEVPRVAAGHNDHFAYLPADLDGDGLDELYVVDTMLYRLELDGTVRDSVVINTMYPDFNPDDLSAVDIDNDGKLELIIFGYFWYSVVSKYPYCVYAIDEDMTIMPGWPHDTRIPQTHFLHKPIFSDIDNDGELEYLIAEHDAMNGGCHAWNIDGSPLSGDSINSSIAVSKYDGELWCPVMSDINSDGFPDISAMITFGEDETYDFERITAWDRVGQVLTGWPITTTVNPTEYGYHPKNPIFGDINDDGYTDLIMTSTNDRLLFLNLEGNFYHEQTTPVPCWRYNRRLNNIGPIRNLEVACGDADGTGAVNILDATFIINYLYRDGPAPDPPENADIDSSGGINILDVGYLVNYLYRNGPEPDCP